MKFHNRAVPIALAAVLIDTIGFGITMPVLPELLTHLGHIGLEQATRFSGWMLAVFAIGQFFAGPIIGNLGDRFGRRPVLMLAMLAFGIDYALMAVAPTIAWLFLGRLIAGVAGAVYSPAAAVLADVTPPEKRSGVFGLIGAAFGIGFIIGPALGGPLAHIGLRAPFVAAAVLALVNALVMFFALRETLTPENRRPFRFRDAHIVGAFKPLFETPEAAPLLLAWFLWQIAHQVYPSTWSFWGAIRFGWGPSQIGISFACAGLVMAAVQGGLTSRAVALLGERKAIVVGLSAGVIGLTGLAFVTSVWQVAVMFVVGAFSGFVHPSTNGLMSRMVDASRQGALQGGIGAMNSAAMIIGPVLFSTALANGNERGFPGAAFLTAALLIGVALLIVVWKVLRLAEPTPAPQLAGTPAEEPLP